LTQFSIQADGVGGWLDVGIDPSLFTHELCNQMARFASSYTSTHNRKQLGPNQLMQIGYDLVCNDSSILGGGSTACVGIARPDGSLEVANLGDSGFAQLRLKAVHYYSDPQVHEFNAPYQLAKTPERLLMQRQVFGGNAYEDTPKDANVTNHELRHGDVLVFGTDGVWDNLAPQDVLQIVSRYMLSTGAWEDLESGVKVGEKLDSLTVNDKRGPSNANSTLQRILAAAVASEANTASMDKNRDGPYAKEATARCRRWSGGKVDDVCVVVAVVVKY
jgi:protein phosphatase PTC7